MFDVAAINDVLLPIFLFAVYFISMCCFQYQLEQIPIRETVPEPLPNAGETMPISAPAVASSEESQLAA